MRNILVNIILGLVACILAGFVLFYVVEFLALVFLFFYLSDTL